jgi:ATP-dependent RNA helicase SUPV3L1/SUV3
MRRLRENTTLDSEISKTGEVTVEGHLVGRLEGFSFAADPSAGGSEAKALHAAAQKALAGEIEARAGRLSQAPDEQFVLTSDGTVRWTGDAVARLVAGEDVMRPRLRILADEQLTGPAREQVQARLDLWLKAHIDKLLGPLTALGAAEDVTGIGRGVAYRLIEDLGVLERQKVADDVKGLDQPQRAALRKYGVRFGAYHLYVPPLLKPAPRTLATLLYALKHDGGEMRGLDDVQQLAASGRTSIPANKDIARNLYRVAGYRVCGERAVRVDILERLADLIRPALAWRDNAPGVKPAGALDGTGFTVTVGMTSLVGSSGEDFASILRALGYRMERRPKPPEAAAPAPVEAPGEIAPAEALADPAEAIVVEEAAAPEAAPETGQAESVQAESVPAEPEQTEPEQVEPEQAERAEPAQAEAAPAEAASDLAPESSPEPVAAADAPEPPTAAAEEGAVAAEPAMIEVWRPGRFEHRERRPKNRHHRRDDRKAKPQGEAAQAAAAAETSAGDAAAPADVAKEREQRHEPRGERHGRPPRRPHKGRHGSHKPERPERPQRPERREREREPDPNSPFAKLAALKAQLEAGAKERR